MEKFLSVPKEQQIAWRWTPVPDQLKDWTLDKVLTALQSYDNYLSCIVCYEVQAEKPHYQGYFCFKNPENDPYYKRSRKWFKKTFDARSKDAFSWVRVKDPKDYRKYLVKEGYFKSHNFNHKELERFQLISYPKKKQFQEELDEIEMQYTEGSMSGEQYLFEFMKLKGKYRQVINTKYAQQRLLMLIARTDEGRLRDIARVLYQDLRLV